MRPERKASFIRRAKEAHGDKYDYGRVEYTSQSSKITIGCRKCGRNFQQTPSNHFRHGCPGCAKKVRAEKTRVSEDEFRKRAAEAHGGNYCYDGIEGLSATTKIEIRCKECNKKFRQQARLHMDGYGCPHCRVNRSKGELEVEAALKEMQVGFKPEYRNPSLRDKKPLPIDFLIPSLRMAIEYDGPQHFEAIDWFGGEEALAETQRRDRIKDEWCKNVHLKLVRIRHDCKDPKEEVRKSIRERREEFALEDPNHCF